MTERILIVEDEAITALDLKITLIDLGYEVIDTVDNGEDAIKIAVRENPDLTIMDIKLKGEMTGIDVSSKLAELDLPVIYLTANSDNDTFNKSLANSSAYAFIRKPFKKESIKTAIKFAINKSKIENEKLNLAQGFVDWTKVVIN